jgi:hypothetical protein
LHRLAQVRLGREGHIGFDANRLAVSFHGAKEQLGFVAKQPVEAGFGDSNRTRDALDVDPLQAMGPEQLDSLVEGLVRIKLPGPAWTSLMD